MLAGRHGPSSRSPWASSATPLPSRTTGSGLPSPRLSPARPSRSDVPDRFPPNRFCPNKQRPAVATEDQCAGGCVTRIVAGSRTQRNHLTGAFSWCRVPSVFASSTRTCHAVPGRLRGHPLPPRAICCTHLTRITKSARSLWICEDDRLIVVI